MQICIDFDGTCVTHEYPNIGKNIGAEVVLKKLTDKGHQLILFTMRDDKLPKYSEHFEIIEPARHTLSDAINWFHINNIPLFGIQKNPDQHLWTSSPKAYGQLYIDDATLGCPLIYDNKISARPFVDWTEVEKILIKMKLI